MPRRKPSSWTLQRELIHPRFRPLWDEVRFLPPLWDARTGQGDAFDPISGERGTFFGAGNWQVSTLGRGYEGDGTSGRLQFPHSEIYDWETDQATMICLVLPRSVSGGTRTWLRKADVVDRLILRQANANIEFIINDTPAIVATGVLAANRWHAVAATYNGVEGRIHSAGIRVAEVGKTGNLVSTDGDPIWIGGRTADRFFDGWIVQVGMFARAWPLSWIQRWSADPLGLIRQDNRVRRSRKPGRRSYIWR